MTIPRARYRERQRLTASDLCAEQDYRLSLAGIHHLGPHDWGVVRGLRLRRIEGNRFELGRGIAVDGYGRALLVAAPLAFTIDGFDKDQCWHVAIYYCEDGAQARERDCQDVPAPRIRSRVVLQATRELLAPDAPANYSTARAAGPVGDSLPWPVLVGRVGLGCTGLTRDSPLFDYAQVRYVRHRASRLRSPTSNARLQLGLAGIQDAFHFLLSTRDDQAEFRRRVGVDRDGVAHVWKPLLISGPEMQGTAALGHNVQLSIRLPSLAGLGQSLRIEGLVDAELKNISASLEGFGPAFTSSPTILPAQGTLERVTAPLMFSGFQQASVSVLNTSVVGTPRPFEFSAARRRFRAALARLAVAADAGQPPPTAPKIAFSMQMWTTGGGLYPHNVVQFRPAAALAPDPLLREIHAVVTSKPADVVPESTLRVSGGEADASDASGRVSAGARTAAGYVASLRMNGRGGLRMLAAPDVTDAQELLAVEGTTYLPAIGKNDPMLPDLLTLAHMCGQVQIGNLANNPKLELDRIDPTEGHYKLSIKRGSGSFTVKRALELIYGDEATGPADMSVRVLENLTIPSANQATEDNKITVPGLAPTGRNIRIAVLMLVDDGNKSRVAIGREFRIVIP